MRLLDPVQTANNIAAIIKNKGITKSEIARQMNITNHALYNWLEYRTLPTLDNLVILTGILDCTFEDIIAYKEVK